MVDWFNEVSSGETGTTDWYGEVSRGAPAAGTESPGRTDLPYPRLNEKPAEGFFGKAAALVTGKGKREYDLPEFDLPSEFSGRQFSTILGMDTTFRPERKVEVLKKNYPDLKFQQDSHGNVIVDASAYNGTTGYLNSPGLSPADVSNIPAVAAFLPAGRLAGLATSVGGKIAAGAGAAAGTQAALDVGNQALGGTKEVKATNIEPSDVAFAAGGGALGEALGAVAGRVVAHFRGVPQITPEIRQAFQQEAVNAGRDPAMVTDELIQSYIRAAQQATTPAAIRAAQQRDEFGIPYTAGQRSGDLKQLQLEDSLRHGALGSRAQTTMTNFAEQQQAPAIAAARARQQAEIGGGRSTIEQAAEAGGMTREGVRARAAAAEAEISDAYEAVGDAFMSTKGMKGLTNSLIRTAKTNAFEMDPRLAPASASLLGQLDDFAAMLKGGAGKIRPYHIRKLESFRRVLNNKINTALNATDRRQIVLLKQNFDQYLDDAVTRGLMSGDPGALEALQIARALRADYARKFQNQPTRTRSGMTIQDPPGKMMEDLIAADPTDEQVMNYMFGASRLGGKNAGAQVAGHLREVLGADSQEWQAIRQAAFLKLTEPTRGAATTSGQVMGSRLGVELTQNPTLMRILFSPQEIHTMQRLSVAIRRAQPDAMNPSKTSYKLSQIAQQIWENVATSIGFQVGGAPGAIVARQGTRATSGWRASRAAAAATRAPTRPLRSIPLSDLTAPGSVGLNTDNPKSLPAP